MKWLLRSLVALAFLAGIGVLIYLATLEPPEVEEIEIPEVAEQVTTRPEREGLRPLPKRGGY